MVTWKMSRSRYSCSLGQQTTACSGPMPSTRSTGSRGRLSPPPAMKPSCPTPKSWRSLCSQKITCEPCKLEAGGGRRALCPRGQAPGSAPAPSALLLTPRPPPLWLRPEGALQIVMTTDLFSSGFSVAMYCATYKHCLNHGSCKCCFQCLHLAPIYF